MIDPFGRLVFGNPLLWPEPPALADWPGAMDWLALGGEGLARAKWDEARAGFERGRDLAAGNHLEAELRGYAERLNMGALLLLEAQGVPRRVLAGMCRGGEIGLARIHEFQGRCWEPEGPTARLVIGVRSEDGELVDLLAISSTDPDRWSLRTGFGWALGLDGLARVRRQGGPLVVHGTPRRWLAHAADQSGNHICILDWKAAHVARLRALGPGTTFLCESEGAAEALRAQLAFTGLPGVEVVRDDRREAA